MSRHKMKTVRHYTCLAMLIATAFVSTAPAAWAFAPEYKACHAGNRAACKHWRDRSCYDDANPAACDYDEAQKQKEPMDWCAARYQSDDTRYIDEAAAYRWCVNGHPDP
jgi:hypothetical protein